MLFFSVSSPGMCSGKVYAREASLQLTDVPQGGSGGSQGQWIVCVFWHMEEYLQNKYKKIIAAGLLAPGIN